MFKARGIALAIRYGRPVDLWDEAVLYLRGLPYGAPISKWSLRDFLDGCRGNEFPEKEFEEIIARLRDVYNIALFEGSLSESMQLVSTDVFLYEMKSRTDREDAGFRYLSKFDELELLRTNKPSETL